MMDLADGDDEEQGGIADGSSAATYKIFQAAGELTIRRGLHLSLPEHRGPCRGAKICFF
jgi:hypothetical protein